MLTVIWYKVVLTFVLILIRLSAGLAPVLITLHIKKWTKTDICHQKWVDQTLSIISNVGGGALLATCFIHMIPEIRECLEDLPSITLVQKDLAYAELLVCVGFFLAYFLEETVHYVLANRGSATLPRQLASDSPVQWAVKTNTWFERMDHDSNPDAALRKSQGQLDRERDPESEADACSRCLSAGVGEGGGLHVSEQLRLSRGQRKKSVLVVLALSFHSVFEGMAIGLERNLDDARYLFAAVALHESTMLFCIGLEMVASQAAPTPTATIILNLATLALVSPLGVVIGTLLTLNQEDMDSYSQRIVIGTLQGLAAGTILYVTFFEMLDKQRTQETGIVRASFILCGFIIMLFFSVRGGHTHARLDEKNLFSPCNYSNDQQEPQIKR